MSDSLVRVLRRAEWGAHRPTPWSAQVPKHASGRALPSTIATMTYLRAYRRPGLGHRRNPRRSTPRVDRRTSVAVPHPIRAHRRPHPLPSRQFQALFDSLFKVLFIFSSRYLFAIGLIPLFNFGRNLPPD
ncbi:hypothetical protein HN51_057373 [Arachis hypogaea]